MTRIYPIGIMGGFSATCLIVSLETSDSVTAEQSHRPRHGGCDVAYLAAAAYESNRMASVTRPSKVAHRMLFLASNSRTKPIESLIAQGTRPNLTAQLALTLTESHLWLSVEC